LEALFDIKYRSLSGRLNKCFFFSKVENDAKQDESQGFGCCDYVLIGLSYVIGVIFFPIFFLMSIKIVKEYERAVIMRLGRINGGAKGPGLFWVLPCTDTIQIVDLRTLTFDVPPQEILTKDSVTVAVDAVCYFRTFNPVMAVTKAENATNSTRLILGLLIK
jgi:erythrocyte band 7 integral membrane protein